MDIDTLSTLLHSSLTYTVTFKLLLVLELLHYLLLSFVCSVVYYMLLYVYYMLYKLCSEYLYRVYVMLCYVILCLLCYAMVGCCVVPCPKNFSAQSDPVSFCASDNKRLVTCKIAKQEHALQQKCS